MALKTKKKLFEKLNNVEEALCLSKISQPEFFEAYLELETNLHSIFKKIGEVYEKNKISHQNNPEYIKLKQHKKNLISNFYKKWGISPSSFKVVNSKIEIDESIKNIDGIAVHIDTPLPEIIGKIVPAKEKYLTLLIDTFEEKEIILAEVSRIYDWINEMRTETGVKLPKDKCHVKVLVRRYKVFNLRNQRPPMKFKEIVFHMITKGFYKDETLEKAENLAKKDYAAAYRKIHGIPYKEHNKSQLKKSNFKGCASCEARQKCKEPCSQAEYYLSLDEKKQSELLFNRGVTDIIHPEDLKEAKQKKRAMMSEDEEEWRQEEIERGIYKK
ncbi:MAG: hypothetical protein PHC54_02500 [Candidatus Omnitrophica bacterium]|nr:hypothetical protein [Candidatus Omnitrophota bacterium]MDD5592256.1 hypothetical protein [Candidatus Omnitrophota bacterium]